tara:strand:- start:35 stop:247 length:213 start_codon:yes stop_codon:yes gene_type:complete
MYHSKHSQKIYNIANQGKIYYKTKFNKLTIELINLKKGSFTSQYLKNNINYNNYNNIISNRNLSLFKNLK